MTLKSALLGAVALLLSHAAQADQTDLVAAGRAVAAAGDCAACHSIEGGKPYAGGLPMKTPLGTIYSTNITPSASGIGEMSEGEFIRAVRAGVAKDGHRLYPAMPFPSYARMTDTDLHALYAYFMQDVAPVEQPNRASDIPWPLSMRWPLAFWDRVFAGAQLFTPSPDHDARWNRGAYLVQAAGHCGACHTPRGIAFQEKAMSDADGAQFLAGAGVNGWLAKSLRGDTDGLASWSEPDITEFLRTGRNAHTAAFGEMTEVITHSGQYLSAEDLASIAHYLKSLSGNAPAAAVVTAEDNATAALRSGDFSRAGATVYGEYCITCHRADGTGYSHIFPALAGNTAVLSNDPSQLAHITLAGGQMAATDDAAQLRFAMPSFAQLPDRDVASVLTFVRSAWGNHAAAVTADQVAAMRKQAAIPMTDRPAGVPASFNPPHDTDMPAAQAALIMQGKRLLTDTKRLLPEYVGSGLNCTSCHLGGGKVAFASPFVGLSQAYPSYNPRAGREVDLRERINGCFLRSMNGKEVPPHSREMDAMVAYIDWLSASVPKGAKFEGKSLPVIDAKLVPNSINGQKIYGQQCASCHGDQGQGLKDARGEYVFPPLWGDDSFNIGAGTARTYPAAAFVLGNMPIGHGLNGLLGQGGTLTPQEAVDVAEYFSHQPRPDFPAKVDDWPKGGKPKDSRY